MTSVEIVLKEYEQIKLWDRQQLANEYTCNYVLYNTDLEMHSDIWIEVKFLLEGLCQRYAEEVLSLGEEYCIDPLTSELRRRHNSNTLCANAVMNDLHYEEIIELRRAYISWVIETLKGEH